MRPEELRLGGGGAAAKMEGMLPLKSSLQSPVLRTMAAPQVPAPIPSGKPCPSLSASKGKPTSQGSAQGGRPKHPEMAQPECGLSRCQSFTGLCSLQSGNPRRESLIMFRCLYIGVLKASGPKDNSFSL